MVSRKIYKNKSRKLRKIQKKIVKNKSKKMRKQHKKLVKNKSKKRNKRGGDPPVKKYVKYLGK